MNKLVSHNHNVIQAIRMSFDFNDTSVVVGTIPPGAVILDAIIVISTSYDVNDATMIIGDAGKPDGIAKKHGCRS